uniref:Calmodulin-binding domain-containing protein n=1 Tax=Noccaea caerulescens TaxID=107243 RepID=A0A1J3DHH7_NOCCA
MTKPLISRMAEESVRLPDSPDVNRSWRRISTGKLSFLYSQEKIIPNYLRSPTGSCHDACKYGRKHESEDKPRVSPPLKKRFNRSFDSSPLRNKALTNSVLNPCFGYGKYDFGGGSDHEKRQVINFSDRACDGENVNAESTTNKKAVSLSDSAKRKKKKKTVSHIDVSRGRALEMVEHNKRVTALKLKSVAQTAAIALRRSTVNRKKINGGSKAAEPKKVAAPLRASMSSKRYSGSLKTKNNSLSSVPLRRTRKLVDEKCKDLVEEKTLYVIKMKTGNETIESDQNQRCVMNSPSDDPPSSSQLKNQGEAEDIAIEDPETEADDVSSEEEEDEDDDGNNVSFSDDKNTSRQTKSQESMKLRFKRGKIVDFGSRDNSPRKLKFKRGKTVTGADTNSKSSGGRSLKSKGNNFRNDKEQQNELRSSKVVLKHQDTQKKRDSRVLLFNNVIEETANKLVETRKSKVKALVGAFESVISFQENISSATT